MIIFSNQFAASQATTATPLTHPRIGYHTWTRNLEPSAVVASSEADDAPGDAVLRPDTAEYWQPSALPATLVIDLGAGRDLDYVGLAGHTLGSAGAAVSIETSDGSFAGSPAEQVWSAFSTGIAPGNDAPLLFLDASRVCRYVRISLTGGSTMPTIAVAHAGEILAMERMIYGGHAPLGLSRETVLHRSLSRGGQFLGQGFRRHGVAGEAAFRYLTPDWYRTNFDPFVESARQHPFFFAWRPADYPLEVAFVWATDDIRPANIGVRDFMSVSVPMHGIGHE